jgi:hypothetical protein
MRPMMILAASALGALLVALSTSRADALGYTSTDINVLSTRKPAVFRLSANNSGRSVGSYVDSTGRASHD